MGRSGVIVHRERHLGGFDIVRVFFEPSSKYFQEAYTCKYQQVHVKDILDRQFATRIGNVFVVGQGNKPWVSLPKGKGVKLSVRFLSFFSS